MIENRANPPALRSPLRRKARITLISFCLALVAAMAFFSFTDTAWVWLGRPNESYPELVFGMFGIPISVFLLALSIVLT